NYEPHEALDGGEDGLDFYRAVASKWKGALRLGGRLIFEVGMGQNTDVEAILSENGFEDVHSVRDTQGILRVVSGTINE
ncbi:MAG: peptide chain release factor N(5)-glutamine methyltransferase, partial [Oscillospiraceae bacterium]|nr:peptide chain release factor N(5)-glutamine methyltransferase [Oscillospiraceae bacterium]